MGKGSYAGVATLALSVGAERHTGSCNQSLHARIHYSFCQPVRRVKS